MKRLLAYLFLVLGLGLTFNVTEKAEAANNEWMIVFDHPKYRSEFIMRGKSKEETIKKVKIKCLKWVQYSLYEKKKYTQGDWDECKLKKAIFIGKDNSHFIAELYKGKSIKKIKKYYNLTTKKINSIQEDKYELEQKKLNKYVDILKQGKSLDNQYLEKETLISVKNKKLQIEHDNIFKYIEELHKGKSLGRFFLENETLAKIPKKKAEVEPLR